MIPNTPQVLGFFNLLVGLMLTVSVLLFIGGFATYLTRLGTWPTYRTEAVNTMEWGVSVLFVLIVLLAIQQFFAAHILFTVTLVGLVVILLVAWVIVKEATSSPPAPPPGRNGDRG